MRQFVVLSHTAALDPDFSLDDLAGGAGRLDVLCRCVNAAFVLSHAIRENVRVHLVLRDAATIRFEGADLRSLNPDERNIAALIRRALESRDEAVGHQSVETTPGVSIANLGFETVLSGLDGTVVHLHEDGTPVVNLDPPAHPVFVLSDHRDFTDDEASLLEEAADVRASVGPERLHADHAMVVVHNYLDTDGYTTY